MIALDKVLGIELDPVSWREKVVSGVGAAVAMAVVYAISHQALGLTGAQMLVASSGATAVLLFGAPHGALSQPWPVFASHLLCAAAGVSAGKLIDDRQLAAACALGLSVLAMHQLKCLHPPGGATALTAVFGGPGVSSLGYSFLVRPVLLNVLSLLAVAVLFNALFPWRRYPAVFSRARVVPPGIETPSGRPAVADGEPRPAEITHERILAALRSLDSFIDVTEADVVHLHRFLSAGPPAAPVTPRAAGTTETSH